MRSANLKNTRFVVDLGHLKLDDEETNALNAAIQGAVLTFLGTHHKMPSRRVRLLYWEPDQNGTTAGGATAGMVLEPEEPEPDPEASS
jgi:hypothetical protein